MNNPNLIHPVRVVIQQLSNAGIVVDDDYRETLQGGGHSAPITTRGQIKWGKDEGLELQRRGVSIDADGYVLFRTIDLRSAGITAINLNDRFLSFGNGPNMLSAKVFVVHLEPVAHYGDAGGATMVKAWFKDRDGVK